MSVCVCMYLPAIHLNMYIFSIGSQVVRTGDVDNRDKYVDSKLLRSESTQFQDHSIDCCLPYLNQICPFTGERAQT